MNFVFKNRPLVAEGETMIVNAANRLRYCSLVGKACLDSSAWLSASALAKGAAVPEQ